MIVRVRLDVAEPLADAVHVHGPGDVAVRVERVHRDVLARRLDPHLVEDDELVAGDGRRAMRQRHVGHADVFQAGERLHDVKRVFRVAAVGYEVFNGRRPCGFDVVDRDLDERFVDPLRR